MLFQCWASVEDGGPTLKQHWMNVPEGCIVFAGHFVWEAPRGRRHSLEFPPPFFNRMNRDMERSNFSDAQLFEYRIRIRTYGFTLEHLSNRHFCRITRTA